MFFKLINIFHKIKGAILLTRVRNKIYESNFLEAQILLEDIKECSYNYTYFIFYAIVLEQLNGKENEIIRSYNYALSDIKSNTNCNEDEKKYILKYIYRRLLIHYKYSNEIEKVKYYEREIKKCIYESDKVRSFIKKDFTFN